MTLCWYPSRARSRMVITSLRYSGHVNLFTEVKYFCGTTRLQLQAWHETNGSHHYSIRPITWLSHCADLDSSFMFTRFCPSSTHCSSNQFNVWISYLSSWLQVLENEIFKFEENICDFEEDLNSSDNIPGDMRDTILTVIGMAKLLMAQKLTQFRGLCDKNIVSCPGKILIRAPWDQISYIQWLIIDSHSDW